MKTAAIIVLVILLSGCQTDMAKKVNLDSQKNKVSYSIGIDIGSNFKKQSLEVDFDALTLGIADAFLRDEQKLSDEDMQTAMAEFQKEMSGKQNQERNTMKDKNKLEGEAFLAENAKKDGVVTLKSGLQYKVINEGTGKTPTNNDQVETHYRGTLIDGTEFDSSYKRGETATFPVSGVIAGWTEALQLMKVGAKWQLFILSDLAYGARGASGLIGPDATLIFDIELIAIK